ncbi:nitrite reductase [Rhodococcus sp. IEGM 1408]|uniref:nitrite reductase n=1 Tax=Rhodococcus sp. IEGM 1408 TaxID=3082220 RepID=UPI0029540B82|nr:nitrite reductase [Rhodococcus sp. IEGM 1408]MDV8002981.1 nitrite reductase [Rhodococcus sp. IEGM 1408]
MSASQPTRRTRTDMCPGVLRPWPADDGALVRLRVPGGRISPTALAALHGVAARYGDDDVHVTARANLQLRALPTGPDGQLDTRVISAIAATGLLPAPTHDLVRNILVSPLTGLSGGRADLRPVTERLDAGLRADPGLAGLSGRFLFVLDDGRGDLVDRAADLGLAVLDSDTVQLRVGEHWSRVVPVDEAADHLLGLAREFARARGDGPDAPWHVRELSEPLVAPRPGDGRVPSPSPALPYGPVPGSTGPLEHVEAPDGILDRALIARLTDPAPDELVVTPWRGVLIVRA